MKSHKKKTLLPPRLMEIQTELHQTRIHIDTIENNFRFAVEQDLIDSYIYEINAAWKRYDFLLHEIRSYSSS